MTCRHVVDFSFNEANHDAGHAANTSPTAALSGKLDSVGWTVWARRMIVLPIGERWAHDRGAHRADHPAHHLRRPAHRLRTGRLLHHGRTGAALADPPGYRRRTPARRRPRRPGAGRPRRLRAARRAVAGRARGRGRTGSFLAPAMAFLSAAVLLVCGDFPGRPHVLAHRRRRRLLRAAGRPRPWPGRSRAPSTGWCRPSSGPASTAPSWCWPPVRTSPERCPRRSGWSRRSPTITTTRSTASAVAPERPPRWLVRATGGHEGRILVITVLAAALSPSGFTIALTALAVVLALLVLTESIRFWVSSQAPAVHDEQENPHDRPRAGCRRRTASAPLHRHPAQGSGAGRRGHRPSST